jgi:hypothetical protein
MINSIIINEQMTDWKNLIMNEHVKESNFEWVNKWTA